MYCLYCGKQIPDQAKYCDHCGSEVGEFRSSESTTSPSEELLFTIKPEFNKNYVMTLLIPFFVFLSFFISVFLFIIRSFFSNFFFFRRPEIHFTSHQSFPFPNDPINTYDPFEPQPFIRGSTFLILFIALAIAFVVIYVLVYNLIKKHYSHSAYHFYGDRVEYIDGYFNRNEKRVPYKNIISVSMHQNVFQKKYNTGTIRLVTNEHVYHNSRNSNGITLMDIPNVHHYYEELNKIIK